MKGYYGNNTPESTLSANKWLCVLDKWHANKGKQDRGKDSQRDRKYD